MDRIQEILSRMTTREKAMQVFQLSLALYREDLPRNFTGPMQGMAVDDELLWQAGSIIGESNDVGKMSAIQKTYAENNRLGIPAVVMADVIHGYRTIFPIPLALACSWQPALFENTCRVAAKEAAACGVHVTFAPMADLVRDPRWGRVMEATGEDPCLNARYAAASVRGYQGEDLTAPDSLAACVKHFAAYGAGEAGREYNTVDVSRGMLREYYMGAYKAAVEAGCRLVMTSFNLVERTPATCNTWLLQDILRGEWGFDGLVISDWNSVDEIIAHGVAENGADAARLALLAGVDMDMMAGHYPRELEMLAKDNGTVEKALNMAAERVLRLKDELGLLDGKRVSAADDEAISRLLLCDEHRAIAREAAEKSVVLLENNGVLPLQNGANVALLGGMAETDRLMGFWRCQGREEDCTTLPAGLRALGVEPRLAPVPYGDDAYIDACCKLAAGCDVAVVVCGEDQDDTGEGGSRTGLRLPARDTELIRALANGGCKVVTIVHSGRPLVLEEEAAYSDALVQAWFLGSESGNALARLLLGECAPQGRLPMSFPRTEGQVPVYYNAMRTGRPKCCEENTERYVSKYIDCPNAPLYPFGYGLLYTQMAYGVPVLSADEMSRGGTLQITVPVKNTGRRTGTETVQLYLRDEAASVARPVMELKDYRQVELAPGEEQNVLFTIDETMLEFYGADGKLCAEPGRFTVLVGPNAAETTGLTFGYKA